MSTFEPSASARPLVISGTALAIPPDPVLVPTPAPVRLNHVSNVNCAAPKPGAAPNVTYWLEPFNWRAVGVPAAVAPPMKRTAAVRMIAIAAEAGRSREERALRRISCRIREIQSFGVEPRFSRYAAGKGVNRGSSPDFFPRIARRARSVVHPSAA